MKRRERGRKGEMGETDERREWDGKRLSSHSKAIQKITKKSQKNHKKSYTKVTEKEKNSS